MRNVLIAGVMLLFSISTISQELPENADPNKCYVKSKTPDLWKDEEVSVKVTPSYTLLVSHPSEFNKIREKVVIKEGEEKMIITPASYKTIEIPVEIKEKSEEVIKIPGKRQEVNQKVVIEEASVKIEVIPAVYKTIDIPVVIEEAKEVLEVIPAKYEVRNIKVVTKEESFRLKAIPASYGKKAIIYQKRDYGTSLSIIPAVFHITKDSIKVKSSYGHWQMSDPSPNCVSKNIDDCRFWFYKKEPPIYEYFNNTFLVKDTEAHEEPNCIESKSNKCGKSSYIRKVIKTHTSVDTIFIPSKVVTMKKMVMVEPPHIQKIKIPAVIKVYKKKVMVTPPTTRVVTIPEKSIIVKKIVTEPDIIKKTISLPSSVTVKKEIVDIPASAKLVKTTLPTYATVNKVVVSKKAWKEEVTVKPKFKTFTKKTLIEKGGKTTWKEIDCDLVKYNVLPIMWDFGSYRLTLSAKKIIDQRLLPILQTGVALEILAYTDSKGSKEKNLKLSIKRAKSVVKYLISKGIDPSKLVAKGYGESKLINHCTDGVKCTEEQHAMNRRIEFRVINQR